MPALLEMQRGFAATLRGGQAADRGHELYRQTVLGTQAKALAAVYPVIARLLGEDCFDSLCRRAIRELPSRSGDLHDFGGGLGDLLAGMALGDDYPYLPDVARLEWAMHRVFHARDTAPLDMARLAAVAPERHGDLRFHLAPASALLVSDYPVQRIWEANQPDRDGELAIAAEPTHLLLLRQPAAIVMLPLARGVFALLAALRGGEQLGVALERALLAAPDMDAQAALAAAVGRGAIIDFTLNP